METRGGLRGRKTIGGRSEKGACVAMKERGKGGRGEGQLSVKFGIFS